MCISLSTSVLMYAYYQSRVDKGLLYSLCSHPCDDDDNEREGSCSVEKFKEDQTNTLQMFLFLPPSSNFRYIRICLFARRITRIIHPSVRHVKRC